MPKLLIISTKSCIKALQIEISYFEVELRLKSGAGTIQTRTILPQTLRSKRPKKTKLSPFRPQFLGVSQRRLAQPTIGHYLRRSAEFTEINQQALCSGLGSASRGIGASQILYLDPSSRDFFSPQTHQYHTLDTGSFCRTVQSMTPCF